MIKKFPIIRPDISIQDIIFTLSVSRRDSARDFNRVLRASFGAQYGYLINSGIAAFYLCLQALKSRSSRTEVILPAYTAGSLVVAVRKAGLKAVLCDITGEDFNADTQSLLETVSANTLAVVAVHMFGIPLRDIAEWKRLIPAGVWLIEDCCQAMGSKYKGLPVGSFGDLSFYSFNRGKNFTTCGGGYITANNEELVAAINQQLKPLAIIEKQALAIQLGTYLIATNPYIYGMFSGFIRNFKENTPPEEIMVGLLGRAQSALGVRIYPRSQDNFAARHRNAAFLLQGLTQIKGIRLPKIPPDVYPVFNRLPILFEDVEKLKLKQKDLWNAGFETSRMYLAPLGQMFDLGVKLDDFPNAKYIAEHLLTLPVYPALKENHLQRILEVIQQ